MAHISTSMSTSKYGILSVILISTLLDFITSGIGFAYAMPTIFGSVVFEEFLEWMISALVARYFLDDELTTFEQVAGLIPIPGVNALTIKGIIELLKSNYQQTAK